MEIRKYEQKYCNEMIKLFYDTVHYINAKDYSKDQLSVWATGNENVDEWNSSFLKHYTLICFDNERIIGFGDIDNSGYLDRLYVHKDYQGHGIGSALCDKLEYNFQNITTHSSITAKAFFENRGYIVIKKQYVERQGILLSNFIMKKINNVRWE